MCILPGLVMLDLGVGSSLVVVGEEVVGVVSPNPTHLTCTHWHYMILLLLFNIK